MAGRYPVSEAQQSDLVRSFQRSRRLLNVDGDYGPLSQREMELCHFVPLMLQTFNSNVKHAFELALADVGLGGIDGNNQGVYIDRMRKLFGWPLNPGPWCAVFASHKLVVGGGFPSSLASRGARRLVRNVAREGEDITDLALSGEDFLGVASWERNGSWAGAAHVAFIGRAEGKIFYLAGNEDNRRYKRYDIVNWGFKTESQFRDRLIQVATF